MTMACHVRNVLTKLADQPSFKDTVNREESKKVNTNQMILRPEVTENAHRFEVRGVRQCITVISREWKDPDTLNTTSRRRREAVTLSYKALWPTGCKQSKFTVQCMKGRALGRAGAGSTFCRRNQKKMELE